MPWYGGANQTIKGMSAGFYTGGPPKGVLHTTEGSLVSGAIGAFRANNSWPHFLVAQSGDVWQFVTTSLAARALRNLSGGVETNRDHAVQIEVVGFAAQPAAHPPAQWDALRALMRWVEATEGVMPTAPPLPFASRYGQPGTRMSPAVWNAYNGWCGHSHVPENLHWDPGMIDLASLLPTPPVQEARPMYEPPLNLGEVVACLPRPGGVVILNRKGQIFAFNARDAGAPDRHPEYWNVAVDRAVNLAPLGDTGYAVAKEGAPAEFVPGAPSWYAYP